MVCPEEGGVVPADLLNRTCLSVYAFAGLARCNRMTQCFMTNTLTSIFSALDLVYVP